jgi:putative ABC transport system permease protein
VLAVQALEYLLLSVLLAAIALFIGAGAGWIVVTRVFNQPWAPDWAAVAAVIGTACAVTLGIGLLSGVSVLRARPAQALRSL